MGLRKIDRELMIRFGLEEDDLLCVRGSRPKDWKRQAEEFGYDFVYADDCPKGHRNRTRANSCIGCNPAAIRFLRRHSESGWVYVAASLYGLYIKVGCCNDVDKRISSLNSQGYGGQSDWQWLACAWLEKTGPFERELFSSIPGLPISVGYATRTSGERSSEIKMGSLEEALDLFKALATKRGAERVTVRRIVR